MPLESKSLLAAAKCYSCYGASTAQLRLLEISLLMRVDQALHSAMGGVLVTTFAGTAGAAGTADGLGTAARFNSPRGVTVDSAGTIYVANNGSHTIRKITVGGMVTTFAGVAGSAGSNDSPNAKFNAPNDVACDASGNVYVTDTSNHTIRKITPAGVVSTFAGTAGASGSTDANGAAARFNGPRGIASDSAGNLYVADRINHTIRKITPGADVTTLAGLALNPGSADGTGAAARFNFPWGIAVTPSGDVFVGDIGNSTIRKVTPAGVVTTFAGVAGVAGTNDGTGAGAGIGQTIGITSDAAGNLYGTDAGYHTLRFITPGAVVTTLAGLAGVAGTADGPGNLARFNTPEGTAVIDGTGYIGDTGNNTIRKFTLLTSDYTPSTLLRNAACFACYAGSIGVGHMLRLALVAQIIQAKTGTPPTDIAPLIANAKCYICHTTPGMATLLRLSLWTQILNSIQPANGATAQSLLSAANCFECYGGVWDLIELELLYRMLTFTQLHAGQSASPRPSPQSLLATANCYNCYGDWTLLELGLLLRLAQAWGVTGDPLAESGDLPADREGGGGDPFLNELTGGGPEPVAVLNLDF